ncbi:type B 50S ribosomal protein L31 [Salinivibrio costicola]|uniref:Large ribosomal subunit protein bL31B n=1 Tax=Salinivibrio costicola TaxID=51367 RepID=A0ABX6K6L8_SALCS|nr:type B 50S ribosomal protein L31 [Salinivibrio costicola]QIR07099.1 type B 50S ribosomal protein L31 [Salinivibrio costicola]
MKKDIHPPYQQVVFHDTSVDTYFMVGSTLQTSRTIEWHNGKTYPYFPLDVSSASHPVYTGKQRVTNKEGRAAHFARKFGQVGRSHKEPS